MTKALCTLSLLALAAGFLFVQSSEKQGHIMAADAAQPEKQLAHMVYFTLAEKTPENRQKLIDACKKYLTGHEGVVFFGVGKVAEGLDREVNIRDWDVGLHLVFKNRAAHDKYQTHPRHLQFIEAGKPLWKSVKVFDADLE